MNKQKRKKVGKKKSKKQDKHKGRQIYKGAKKKKKDVKGSKERAVDFDDGGWRAVAGG